MKTLRVLQRNVASGTSRGLGRIADVHALEAVVVSNKG